MSPHRRRVASRLTVLLALTSAVQPLCLSGEYSTPTPNSGPISIVLGPDDNLWFTEHWENKIGRITATGTISEFVIPTRKSLPGSITAGPDGNIWFTEKAITNKIGRITPSGTITEFPVPTSFDLLTITAGPDGNLWFVESEGNKIGRITPSGTIT